MSAFVLKAGMGIGHYALLREGSKVAEVWKVVTHYNLARPLTVTTWRFAIDGQPTCTTPFRTRRDAVAEARSRLEQASIK